MRRPWLVIFLSLLLLWLLVTQLNHYLAVWRVYLFAGGLFVTYAALQLPLRSGLTASLLAGLLCDANSPVPPGTHLLLFAAAHAVVFHLRDRIPRDQTLTRVIIALLANLALFLVFSFVLIGLSPAPAVIWPRLIFDLVCSQVFIALVAPWFFALQTRALELAATGRRSRY
jgi:rod shape-determining protein MreD